MYARDDGYLVPLARKHGNNISFPLRGANLPVTARVGFILDSRYLDYEVSAGTVYSLSSRVQHCLLGGANQPAGRKRLALRLLSSFLAGWSGRHNAS